MTQRKVVLTSAGALKARPVRSPSRNVVAAGASAARDAAERSEAAASSVVRNPHPHPIPPRSKTPKGVCGGARAQAAGRAAAHAPAHEADRQHLDAASATTLDGLLSQMTKAERQQLLDRLALENAASVQSRDLDMWSEGVRAALEDAIGGAGGEAYGLMLCKRQLGLAATWRPIEAFMQSSGLADLTVVERQAVYNLLARLVVEAAGFSARRSGAPLSLKLTAQHAGQVGGIFERAFPGYVAAGLAPVVARQSLRQ